MEKEIKNAIIMTVYRRTDLQLMNTFDGLAKALEHSQEFTPENTRIVVVQDGERPETYERVRKWASKLPIVWKHCDTLAKFPEAYNIDGYNNSAYVMNQAVQFADELGAENLLIVCSDVIIGPRTFEIVEKVPLDKTILIGTTVDMGTGAIFCSPQKIWPMLWFLATKTQFIKEIGGWDLEYLRGMAFEDNDFVGRLFLHVGRMVVTNGVSCFHQSHEQTAYSDENKGFEISEKYTMQKWGGSVPFRPNSAAITFDKRATAAGVVHLLNPRTTMPRPQPAEYPKLDQLKHGAFVSPEDPGETGMLDGKSPRVSVTDKERTILTELFTGRDVLEIGTGLGVATTAIAERARSVVTVDPEPWVQKRVFPCILQRFRTVRCVANLDDAMKVKTFPFNAAFIDGTRTYDAVRADIDAVRTAMNGQTAMLVFHDTRIEEVTKAIHDAGLRLDTNFATKLGIGVAYINLTDTDVSKSQEAKETAEAIKEAVEAVEGSEALPVVAK